MKIAGFILFLFLCLFFKGVPDDRGLVYRAGELIFANINVIAAAQTSFRLENGKVTKIDRAVFQDRKSKLFYLYSQMEKFK